MKKRPEEPECILYIRNMPADVKTRFKAWCATRNRSMKKQILTWIYEVIDNPGLDIGKTANQKEAVRRKKQK